MTSSRSPKPLGESSGNAVMLPPSRTQTLQHPKERNDNQGCAQQQPEPYKQPSQAKEERLGGLPSGRRTRSSKYLKTLIDNKISKSKSKKDAEGSDKDKGHKRSKSSTTSYSVFPRPTSQGGPKQRSDGSSDQENQPPPIWAQFATAGLLEGSTATKVPLNDQHDIERDISRFTPQEYSPSKQRVYAANEQPTLSRRTHAKPRPKSECLTGGNAQSSIIETLSALRQSRRSQDCSRTEARLSRKSSSDKSGKQSGGSQEENMISPGLTVGKRGSRVMAAVAALNVNSRQKTAEPVGRPESEALDTKTVDSAFESMLVSYPLPLS